MHCVLPYTLICTVGMIFLLPNPLICTAGMIFLLPYPLICTVGMIFYITVPLDMYRWYEVCAFSFFTKLMNTTIKNVNVDL